MSVIDVNSQSTPESWAQFSHDNITRAEHERMASIQLRTLIDNVLHDTSRDMREQADAVDNTFQRRTVEVDHAKVNLEDNLRKVSSKEIHRLVPDTLILAFARGQMQSLCSENNKTNFGSWSPPRVRRTFDFLLSEFKINIGIECELSA
jgi:histidinol dehydrogenase